MKKIEIVEPSKTLIEFASIGCKLIFWLDKKDCNLVDKYIIIKNLKESIEIFMKERGAIVEVEIKEDAKV